MSDFTFRAKSSVKSVCNQHQNEVTDLLCIGVDGKTDSNTLCWEEVDVDGCPSLRQCKKREHHLTFTSESGDKQGQYLTHKTFPEAGCTGVKMANATLDVLNEYNSENTIQAILVDNTSVNTGNTNGLVVKLEQLLGRPLMTIGCTLHQNELPLRAIMKNLDGDSLSPKTFCGPLGKLCSGDIHKIELVKFKPICNPVAKIHLSEDVWKDLSHDQQILYHYCDGIDKGSMPDSHAKLKIGPLNHARWITLAARLLALYVRSKKPTKALTRIVQFILRVYGPTWFQIKRSGQLSDSPKILHSAIKSCQHLKDEEVEIITRKVFSRTSYCLLPENFMFALLNEPSQRTKALSLIIESRGISNHVRVRTVPQINWNAGDWWDLIELTDPSIHIEPPCMRLIPLDDLKNFKENPTSLSAYLPKLPSHSQSVERAVKLVSTACSVVYGEENRHKTIVTQSKCHEIRPAFESKGQYQAGFEKLFTMEL